ncbi:MAG: sporulation protein YqfD, partial [bacterium]|nr:sporulation protein YqfD [bacterium]
MLKKFNEYMKFGAKGKKLYKFINALHHSHIYCFNQYCKDDTFYAEIYKKNLKLIRQLADEFNISLEIIEFNSVIRNLKKYRFRFGIPIGLIIAVLIFLYFS